jgi:hypothetical protein
MMTIITAKDKRGNVVFHSIEPREMSDKEVAQCLKDWGVDPSRETSITKK